MLFEVLCDVMCGLVVVRVVVGVVRLGVCVVGWG